jgi:uncharacterized protein YecE (DUF72 family)
VALHGYYLGCPAWGLKTWVGRLFPPKIKQADYLTRYAEVFNTVEGNTTFYGLPKAETVARWKEQVPSDFRFCFKFPRRISHDLGLRDAAGEVKRFLDRVAPLGDRLGTLMLQLPPQFKPAELELLAAFLRALPAGFRYAVELRHRAFFQAGDDEHAAADLLRELCIDTVILDARGLHSDTDPVLAPVRRRKPKLPIVLRATGPQPIVRFVPHSDFEQSRTFFEPWLEKLGEWIAEDKKPYFFMHAPDDTFAPENAFRFHQLLCERGLQVGELPPWGARSDPRQLELL